MLNCFVIDDEESAIDTLKKYVLQTPFLNLAGTSKSSTDALSFLNNNNVDLVFLDIHMPLVSGLDLLKIIGNPVILTTAYSQYAVEGFDYDVVDYLLKPISYPRFLKAAQKANALLNKPNSGKSELAKSYFFINGEYKGQQIRVNHCDIDFVEAAKNYVIFHCGKIRHMTKLNLKDAEQMLPKEQFVRVHNSYIIAIDKVIAIEGNQAILQVQNKENVAIPVSATYKPEFMIRINS